MLLLDDDDVVYEYELQKTPESVAVWKRYLDSWESQLSQGQKELRDIVWLYERMVRCVSNFEMWERYIRLMETQNVSYQQVFELYSRCLEQYVVSKDFITRFVAFCLQTYDLDCIYKSVGLVLTKFKGRVQEQETVWNMVLNFIKENMIPIDEIAGDVEGYEDYDDLRMEIYKQLFTENSNEDENKNDDDDDDERDHWSSMLLYKFAMVCKSDMCKDILRLIVKTGDSHVIKRSFDEYLFHKNIHNTLSRPDGVDIPLYDFDLYLQYLNALDMLKLDDDYRKFLDLLLDKFPPHRTVLVIKLADFYMKRSQFDKMEQVLMENIDKTRHMKDFVLLYNRQLNFEQAYIETILDEVRDDEDVRKDEKWGAEIERHLENLGRLTSNYHLKINDLRIRQNANIIKTWVDRADLFDSLEDKCAVFIKAIEVVDPLKVREPGTFGSLWVLYATLYWEKQKYDEARVIFQSAIKVPYPHLKDLETIWENWVSKELEKFGFQRALELLTKSLQVPLDFENVMEKYRSASRKPPAQTILFCSKKLWDLYIDILESRGSEEVYEQVVDAYENILKLKLITPVGVINYANFFKNCNKLNKSLQVYEKGLSLFPPEIRLEIWSILVQETVNPIYKLSAEHVRHTFEQALDDLEGHGLDCSGLYLRYSDFEDKSRQKERAVQILLKGARVKPTGDAGYKSCIRLWDLAIEKCKQLGDRDALREVYKECVEFLPNSVAIGYVIDFANLETSLKEYVRARELLRYGAHLLAPAKNDPLWKSWEEFELRHGDKEHYKEMLVLKQKLAKEMKVDTEDISKEQGNVQFVSSSAQTKKTNPDEIDIEI